MSTKKKRETVQIRISRKNHQYLKEIAREEKITLSKLSDRLLEYQLIQDGLINRGRRTHK